jgi:hypothetical protein
MDVSDLSRANPNILFQNNWRLAAVLVSLPFSVVVLRQWAAEPLDDASSGL